MADPALVISLAAEFVGKPAFKQADTATQKLTKSVKKLGGALGLALGARQILAFGKASAQAFIEDDNAARSLGITIKNLGLEFGDTAVGVNDFISNLEKQTGVLDDELRPAMDRLLRATFSVRQSQKLLALALDISAGTGKSLTSVTQGLQKAFLGNTASLSKLGVGLSKAELTASSFDTIVVKLSTLFAGQASSAAESYAGQLNKLEVAGNNAKEIIGKGIIQALTESSGKQGFGGATETIEGYATSISNLIVDTARFITLIRSMPSFLDIVTDSFTPGNAFDKYNAAFDRFEALRKGNKGGFAQGPPPEFRSGIDSRATKAAAIAAAQAAKLAASQKATVKSQADALKLAKAKAVFDLQKIQIEAALKGKISAEDEIRLKLMKAIEAENLSQVEKYEKALAKAQEKTAELQKAVAAIGTTALANPYEAYETYAADAIALTNSVAQASIQAGLAAGVALAAALSGARLAAQGQAAESAAAVAAAQSSLTALTDAQKTAKDAIATTLQAQQDALTAQAKAQKDALTAENAAILAALQDRLDKEAALKKAAATALAVDGVTTTAAAITDSPQDNTVAILAAAAAVEAIAQIAEETTAAIAVTTTAAAEQAAADLADRAGAGTTNVEITVNAGVIASAEEVAILVQEAIQTLNRRGDPLFTAGVE